MKGSTGFLLAASNGIAAGSDGWADNLPQSKPNLRCPSIHLGEHFCIDTFAIGDKS
jgi:hypothetical protein